eukprot:COSAG01_NODE_38124_length_494_cov_0.592405_2_plen_45_part_01
MPDQKAVSLRADMGQAQVEAGAQLAELRKDLTEQLEASAREARKK